jgi:hypothetical protein
MNDSIKRTMLRLQNRGLKKHLKRFNDDYLFETVTGLLHDKINLHST